MRRYVYTLLNKYLSVYLRPTDRTLFVDPRSVMLPFLARIPGESAVLHLRDASSPPSLIPPPGSPADHACVSAPMHEGEGTTGGAERGASAGDPALPILSLDEAQGRTWDYVVLHGTVHHYDDILSRLKTIRTLCQPETRLLVTYYSFLWSPLARVASRLGLRERGLHSNWITREDVRGFARLAGFRVLTHASRVLLPLWIPLLSGFVNRWLSQMPLLRELNLLHLECWRPVPSGLPGSATVPVSPTLPPPSLNLGRATPSIAPPVSVSLPSRPSVSIVIPARNESGNIEAAFLRTPPMGPCDELIFVEGNSTDNTWEEIRRCAETYGSDSTRTIKIAQQDGKGKKDAVYKGFAMAQNEILMILDADLTVPPESLPMFYEAITQSHGEFVNGTRLVYKMEDEAMRFLNTLGNKFFAAAFSFVLGQPLRDTLCGTKVMTRASYARIEAHRDFFGEFDPFGDFDLLFGASRLGLEIVEVPIRYQARTYGDTNISRFRHGLILFRMLWFAARKLRFI